jgi:serine/threonine protein kinase
MARSKRNFKSGEQLDRFRLQERLGSGAYGQVWLALDEGAYGFRKNVALKILTEAGNPLREEALLREARICGAMNHPNVVDVYGVMRAGDVPFIIMEYVEGETLSSVWRDLEFLNLRFPRSVILELGIAVSEALQHAWTAVEPNGTALRIVHRDLKPANIMVSNRGIAKVGDFGIAKVAPDLSTTRTGKLKGTPSYMPPELWMGRRDFRPAIDLWSLGIILWEMAAGRRFYGPAAMMEIPEIITKRKPADEAAQVAGFFPELAPILERLLQRDLDKRYATGIELAEELRRVRSKIGASGDLLQFIRLVRAGRLDPADRSGSLAALPAIPEGADDWEALIDLAEPKTDTDVPAPLADSLINIEPVNIPDIEEKGLREVKFPPGFRSGEAAPEDETAQDPAPGAVGTEDATAEQTVDSLPRMPNWSLAGSNSTRLPLRNRSVQSHGSLSDVHNVPPTLRREASMESRAAAAESAESVAPPPSFLPPAPSPTEDSVENVALPHTQSVDPLPAAVPLDSIPTDFSASPAETADSNRQMLLYSAAAALVIVIALVLVLS